MTVRDFDGVDDFITFSISNAVRDLGESAFTLVGITKIRSNDGSLFYTGTSDGTTAKAIMTPFSNSWYVGVNENYQELTNVPSGLPGFTQGWTLVGVSKAAGTVAPRGHYYNFNTGQTSWSHQAAGGTLANAPDNIPAVARIGQQTGNFIDGPVAVVGLFDKVLSDAEFETLETSLQNWVDLAPVELWAFNQANVATPVESITGTSDQASITGTAVVTGDDPPGFDFTLTDGAPVVGKRSNPWHLGRGPFRRNMFRSKRSTSIVVAAAIGDGDAVAPVAVASGAGTVLVAGDGSPTAPAAVASGSGTVLVAGAGGATSPAAEATGAGTVLVQGTGVLVAPVPVVSGTGSSLVAGAGDAVAPAAAISGAGTVLVQGSGSAVAPAAVASGTGGSTDTPITGNGDVVAPAATFSGSGTVLVAGSGSVTAPTSGVAGTSTVLVTGSGALMAPAAVLSGAGIARLEGSGLVTATVAIVTGSGVVLIQGSGSAVAPLAIVSGSEAPPPVIPEVLTLTPVIVSPEGLAVPTGYLKLIPLED